MLEYFEHEAQPWSDSARHGVGDDLVETGAALLPRRGGVTQRA
jgi:hypothetical protein